MDSIIVSDGRTDVELPASILDAPDALKGALSYEVWKDVLTNEDRRHLQQFLPKFPTKDTDICEDTVRELFSSSSFNFGNPIDKFVKKLCRGEFGPGVQHLLKQKQQAKFEQYQYAQRRYYHKLLNELIVSTQDYLEAAARAGPNSLPSRHCARPSSEEVALRKDVDVKYKKVLYQCRQEAEVPETSSDDNLSIEDVRQIGIGRSVLDLLDAPVNLMPGDITDNDYLKMLRQHAKRRRERENHPMLDTSTVMFPAYSSRRTSSTKPRIAASRAAARAIPQQKARVIRRTKPIKRTTLNQQPSLSHAARAGDVQHNGRQQSASHSAVMSQLRESALSRPVVRTDYVVRPSTEGEKMELRRQERLRYQSPHTSFTYRMHGFESVVGPVKGAYDKDTVPSKARDHFLLLKNRPPVITILTLVRDAAARMPNGEGTRAEICVLLKDSQFLSPTCTDQQVHQVVSGALDRLHYEKDPCVRYDSSRKVWLYLHYGRTEEEFERLHMAEAAVAKSRKRGTGARQTQRQTKAAKKRNAASVAQVPALLQPFPAADVELPSVPVSESGASVMETEMEPEFLASEDVNSQPPFELPVMTPLDESASTPEVDTSVGGEQADQSGLSSGSSGSGSSSEGSSDNESDDNGGSVSSSSASSPSGVVGTVVTGGVPVAAADSPSDGSSSSS